VSIATLNTIAPGQLAQPCSPVHVEALRNIERLGEEQRAAANRSELFAGRVVLTLLGVSGFNPAGPAPVAAVGTGGQSWQ
jgi:hypothetical protein